MFNYFPDNLADALPRLAQPFLIMHGAQNKAIPLSDAQKAIEAAGSSDKELIVLDGVNGGAEHCNVDDPDPVRQAIADWFAERLRAQPTPGPFNRQGAGLFRQVGSCEPRARLWRGSTRVTAGGALLDAQNVGARVARAGERHRLTGRIDPPRLLTRQTGLTRRWGEAR